MRFTEAAARLQALRRPLPDAPAALTPQRVVEPAAPRETARAAPIRQEAPDLNRRPGDAGPSFDDAFRPSAVLVLVFPDESGEARVLLTARPEADIRHAGQVSFPGGATDPGDPDPVATALREAREEVGLDPAEAGVEVVGALDPVVIAVSGFRLVPVLALAARRPALTPDPREVLAVFDAPVERFFPSAPVELVELEMATGLRLRYGAFDVDGYRIWGATARILGQLGAVLARS